MLTKEQILYLLELLSEETVVAPNKKFPFRVSIRVPGYSKDKKVGAIQAALSIMLEMSKP